MQDSLHSLRLRSLTLEAVPVAAQRQRTVPTIHKRMEHCFAHSTAWGDLCAHGMGRPLQITRDSGHQRRLTFEAVPVTAQQQQMAAIIHKRMGRRFADSAARLTTTVFDALVPVRLAILQTVVGPAVTGNLMQRLNSLMPGTDATRESLIRESVDECARSWKPSVLHKAFKNMSQFNETCFTMQGKMTSRPVVAGDG